MKPITLKRNSWHYALATFWEDRWSPTDNLCTYFWQVVFGFMKALLFVAGGSLGGFLFVAAPLIGFAGFFLEGVPFWELESGQGMLSLIQFFSLFTPGGLLLVGLMVAAHHLDEWQKRRTYERKRAEDISSSQFYDQHGCWPWEVQNKPGVVKLWWRSFKEKTCVKLVFK